MRWEDGQVHMTSLETREANAQECDGVMSGCNSTVRGREREKERKRERDREKERKREREDPEDRGGPGGGTGRETARNGEERRGTGGTGRNGEERGGRERERGEN